MAKLRLLIIALCYLLASAQGELRRIKREKENRRDVRQSFNFDDSFENDDHFDDNNSSGSRIFSRGTFGRGQQSFAPSPAIRVNSGSFESSRGPSFSSFSRLNSVTRRGPRVTSFRRPVRPVSRFNSQRFRFARPSPVVPVRRPTGTRITSSPRISSGGGFQPSFGPTAQLINQFQPVRNLAPQNNFNTRVRNLNSFSAPAPPLPVSGLSIVGGPARGRYGTPRRGTEIREAIFLLQKLGERVPASVLTFNGRSLISSRPRLPLRTITASSFSSGRSFGVPAFSSGIGGSYAAPSSRRSGTTIISANGGLYTRTSFGRPGRYPY